MSSYPLKIHFYLLLKTYLYKVVDFCLCSVALKHLHSNYALFDETNRSVNVAFEHLAEAALAKLVRHRQTADKKKRELTFYNGKSTTMIIKSYFLYIIE